MIALCIGALVLMKAVADFSLVAVYSFRALVKTAAKSCAVRSKTDVFFSHSKIKYSYICVMLFTSHRMWFDVYRCLCDLRYYKATVS